MTKYIISTSFFCSSSEAKRRDPPERPGPFCRAESGDGNAVWYVAGEQQMQNATTLGCGHVTHGRPSRSGLLPQTEIPAETSELQSE